MPRRIRINSQRRPHFIRPWREFRGLSQQVLADRLGMSAAQLSRIETGRQPYTQDLLEACADALRTDPASLLMRDPSDADAIWSVWEHAKPGQKTQIVEVAKTLIKTGT